MFESTQYLNGHFCKRVEDTGGDKRPGRTQLMLRCSAASSPPHPHPLAFITHKLAGKPGWLDWDTYFASARYINVHVRAPIEWMCSPSS